MLHLVAALTMLAGATMQPPPTDRYAEGQVWE
jgi:hypothetical protein